MDACIHELDCAIGDHRQGSSGGADDTDGGCVGEDDDGDYLEELLRNIGPEVLLIRSARGEENLERVQRASRKSLYGVEKVAVAERPKPGSEIQCYRQRRPVAHHLSNHYITTKLYEKQKVQGYGRNSELNRGRVLRLHRILNNAAERKRYRQLLQSRAHRDM